MRFLVDMCLSPKAADFLRNLGYEASHLYEEGLEKLPDRDIFAKARKEEAVVLTHDLDFADLAAASRERLPSVVIFRLRSMHPENVNLTQELVGEVDIVGRLDQGDGLLGLGVDPRRWKMAAVE